MAELFPSHHKNSLVGGLLGAKQPAEMPQSGYLLENQVNHRLENQAEDKKQYQAKTGEESQAKTQQEGGDSSVFSVSKVSAMIKAKLEKEFFNICIRGEISAPKLHSSGHFYFNLKDENASLNGIIWRANFNKIRQNFTGKIEEGVEVIITGKISTFAGRSSYQIIVQNMRIAGVGALMAQFEKLKKKLAAEGLFEESLKKPIPLFPKKIAVITSPTGAVIRDIIHRVKERFPTYILLFPVNVQGEGATAQITKAIKDANLLQQSHRPDLIIVARGGGSVEDLWSFNEEEVVRATYESAIPIISAIGHETDTTLIDYASDKRAPTPTAAAEIATKFTISDIRQNIYYLEGKLKQQPLKIIDNQARCLGLVCRSLKLASPSRNLEEKMQKLDYAGEKLQIIMNFIINNKKQRLSNISIKPQLMINNINIMAEKLSSLGKLLASYNYKNVLNRGFALVKSGDGKLIKNTTEVTSHFNIEFCDGAIEAKKIAQKMQNAKEEGINLKKKVKQKPRRTQKQKQQSVPQQGSLF